jgi:hypothetical protein
MVEDFETKVKEKYYQLIFTSLIQIFNLFIFIIYHLSTGIGCNLILYLNLTDLILKVSLILIFRYFIKKNIILKSSTSLFFLSLFILSNILYFPILFYNISQGIKEGICGDYIVIVIVLIVFGIIMNLIYICIIGSLNYHLKMYKDISDLMVIEVVDTNEIIDINDKECVICFTKLYTSEKETIKLKCNHPYHKACILNWFQINQTCPICRQ